MVVRSGSAALALAPNKSVMIANEFNSSERMGFSLLKRPYADRFAALSHLWRADRLMEVAYLRSVTYHVHGSFRK
jgi:hypothetical protein